MKKKYRYVLLIIPTVVILLVGLYLSSSELPKGFSKNQLMNISKKFIDALNRRNYSLCYEMFSQIMKSSLSLSQLKAICNPVLDSLGEFVRFKGLTFSPMKSFGIPYVACMVKCQYKNGNASFLISLDKNMEIGGLYIK